MTPTKAALDKYGSRFSQQNPKQSIDRNVVAKVQPKVQTKSTDTKQIPFKQKQNYSTIKPKYAVANLADTIIPSQVVKLQK